MILQLFVILNVVKNPGYSRDPSLSLRMGLIVKNVCCFVVIVASNGSTMRNILGVLMGQGLDVGGNGF